ncbi:TolC family protein [Puia dinghuensis]|uniref:Cation transporter n=1 Tax=Puia dinghuensis TaxID=1792502 RepID=A0A8J2U9C2_9BACT|nr:TolC family protein [Puia dinghuensis]GGA88158.1 cation transporter [Puia dinghuensis]
MYKFLTTAIVSVSLFLCFTGRAQSFNTDSLRVTLPQAEKMFLDSNLQILAQKYNVDATKALIIQARLWPNPNINISNGLYNTQTHKWFQVFDPNDAEQSAQLSQLIVLAGKIKKQTRIAETNYLLSEYGLFDLLRTLKYALRSTYFNIYYLQQTARVYDEEISSLKTVVGTFEKVVDSGYVAQVDVVRVQAQLYSLQAEYQTLIDNLNDQESQLRLLLQTKPSIYVVPQIDTTVINSTSPLQYPMQNLMDSAYKNRTDLMIAKGNLTLSQQNYSLQKALAVPDLTAGLGFDRHGSYIPNFTSVGLGIDIPIFNRNQGNIKSARINIDMNKTQLTLTQKTLEEQVTRGLQRAVDADRLYKQLNPAFAAHFDKLAAAMLENYKNRLVRLLDFLTFYDSYKTNIVQLNTILYNRVNALETINLNTGTNFFN